MMLCALIMAGGMGTRFWPLSTEEKPKQFLNLLGHDTMLQMTVKRLLPLIPIERIFVVTGSRYVHFIREQIYNLPDENIIVEPEGRNTAPCIGLSAFYIDKIYKDASLLVLPSDHLINDEDKFRETVKSGYHFIDGNEKSIVTIGIKPDRPETGYGYIKIASDDINNKANRFPIYRVSKFIEKPDLDTAQKYLKTNRYLWNAGMFIWKTSTIKYNLKKFLPDTYCILDQIFQASSDDYNTILNEKYPDVESISIDFGIMEKADNIYVILGCFGWDDIGSWKAVERYRESDENNNICIGNIMSIKSKNNLVVGSGKPIVLVGMEDAFVIESKDVILVVNKDNVDDIKKIRKKVI